MFYGFWHGILKIDIMLQCIQCHLVRSSRDWQDEVEFISFHASSIQVLCGIFKCIIYRKSIDCLSAWKLHKLSSLNAFPLRFRRKKICSWDSLVWTDLFLNSLFSFVLKQKELMFSFLKVVYWINGLCGFSLPFCRFLFFPFEILFREDLWLPSPWKCITFAESNCINPLHLNIGNTSMTKIMKFGYNVIDEENQHVNILAVLFFLFSPSQTNLKTINLYSSSKAGKEYKWNVESRK